jgi:hypothetical protein
MLWFRRYDAFVSYSHNDDAVVKPLVEILSLNDRKVFWDRELQPGELWAKTILRSLKRSSTFVLFWCCDTRTSQWVGAEIAEALRLKKKIVPVKLCSIGLPAMLAEFQWIDLIERVEHRCNHATETPEYSAENPDIRTTGAARSRRLPVVALVAVLLVTAFLSLLVPTFRKPFPAPVAQAAVEIRTDPAGASVSVDGRAVCTECRLLLPPGAHLIEATQPGYGSVQQVIEVLSGATQFVSLTLRQSSLPGPPELHGFGQRVRVFTGRGGNREVFLLPPSDNTAGTLLELERGRGSIRPIPLTLPKPEIPTPVELPVPWWFTYRENLLWVFVTILSVMLATGLYVRARRRTLRTVDLTVGYLTSIGRSSS